MRMRSVIAACSELAPGRRLIVESGSERHMLPAEPQVITEPENPMKSVALQMAQSAESNLRAVEMLAQNVSQTIERVEREIAEGNVRVAQGLLKLSDELRWPVKPIYDEGGRLIGAERVKPE